MSEIALPIARVSPGLGLPGRFSSDERLARLASGGSERALTVLYERHHQALYRYCRSIVRDHDDAQDALQSTMTHAFMALRSSERDLAVRPWLVPDRAQRGDLDPAQAPPQRLPRGRALAIKHQCGAHSGSARATPAIDRRCPSAASASARSAADARAQQPADRGDRRGAVRLAGGGEADCVRGAQLTARARRGPRDGV